jgi:DNA adenine methylase
MKRFPVNFNDYYEPFIGGGSVLFELLPIKPHINDTNKHLVGVYKMFTVKDEEYNLFKMKLFDLEGEFNALSSSADKKKLYMSYRDMDLNKTAFDAMTELDKAVRFVFLNKTAFNGRYRENKNGQFNVPFGDYKSIKLVNEDFDFIRDFFNHSKIVITEGDFASSLLAVKEGDLVYMDPPYDPIVATELNYTSAGFSDEDQKKVKKEFDRLTSIKAYAVTSNHNTEFIRELYKGYKIEVVLAKRSINSNGSKRGPVEEVIISNFDNGNVFLKSEYVEKSKEIPDEKKEEGQI